MVKEIVGLPTGFKTLDEKLSGLRKGEVVVIASHPSVGKTALAMNIAECVALGSDVDGVPFVGECAGRHPVLYFSLEIPAECFAKRMLCGYAHLNPWRLESKMIDEADKTAVENTLSHAAEVLKQASLYVVDTPALDIDDLYQKAVCEKREKGIELVVIDYLQLCEGKAVSKQGRLEEMAYISNRIKTMAKELMVPVVVLVQLPKRIVKEGESKQCNEPKLSDFLDAAAMEESADVVLLLHRPSYRLPSYCESNDEAVNENLAILDVTKNRNGETGRIKMAFSREFMRFGNII